MTLARNRERAFASSARSWSAALLRRFQVQLRLHLCLKSERSELFSRLFFDEAVAAVRVVIDAVLFLQFLNVPEGCFRVWARDAIAERFVGVQQDFFKTTVQGHAFVRGEVVQEGGEAFLEAHGNIDALDL
jgi:hypothetical protein